jgi:hypothetical protein
MMGELEREWRYWNRLWVGQCHCGKLVYVVNDARAVCCALEIPGRDQVQIDSWPVGGVLLVKEQRDG